MSPTKKQATAKAGGVASKKAAAKAVAEYDTFILTDLEEAVLDTFQEMTIRDLTPGRAKYCCKVVRARMSNDPGKYPTRLWPRLGRGQWVGKPWSIEIAEFIDKIPEAWR